MSDYGQVVLNPTTDRLAALEAQVEALQSEKDQRNENEALAVLTRSVNDLLDHVKARAAQHPTLADDFAEPLKVLKEHAARVDPTPIPGSDVAGVVRIPTQAEAALVKSLVYRLAKGRDHLELSYLRDLADELEIQVLKAAV